MDVTSCFCCAAVTAVCSSAGKPGIVPTLSVATEMGNVAHAMSLTYSKPFENVREFTVLFFCD